MSYRQETITLLATVHHSEALLDYLIEWRYFPSLNDVAYSVITVKGKHSHMQLTVNLSQGGEIDQ